MHSANSEPVVPSVKLFPRLAMTNPSQTPTRIFRPHSAFRRPLARDDNQPDSPHTQVRARLLRMILENERVRRHEQRPSAS